jgi:hypothetical protein
MNNIHLVNYRTAKCEPLKSITRLPKKEAFEVAKSLHEANHRDTTDGFKRFADFDTYYPHRIKTESMTAVNKPDEFPLFLKDELLALLKFHDNDINKLLDFVFQKANMRAIEAQIWNDKYFQI